MNKFDYCEFLSEQGVYEFLKKIGDLKKNYISRTQLLKELFML